MHITGIHSRPILDSRGHPTLETTVELDTGVVGLAAVPSGASTGTHEAVELRDGQPDRWFGQGVDQAVKNVVGPIAKALKGHDVRDQRAIDETMIALDGTVNKSSLGANAILSVSLAVMRANAALNKQAVYRTIQHVFDFPEIDPKQLPRPMMNVINGGKHADSGLKLQEFMFVPNGATVAERLERGATLYNLLGKKLRAAKLATTLGDEGGYAPHLKNDEAALTVLAETIAETPWKLRTDIDLSIDAAASTFFDATSQRYHFGSSKSGLTSVGMIGVWQEWLERFPLLSVEDGLAEDDWSGWTDMTAKLKDKTLVIGDDLFVTNKGRLERGIAEHAANAILIKPNQIGTLTETIETITKAQEAGYTIIISHRSGETMDSFVADLAVAVGAPFVKAGAPARGERVAKYNRLWQIERELTA